MLRVTRAVTLFSKTVGVLLSLAAGWFYMCYFPLQHIWSRKDMHELVWYCRLVHWQGRAYDPQWYNHWSWLFTVQKYASEIQTSIQILQIRQVNLTVSTDILANQCLTWYISVVEINVTLLHVELLLEWQLPLGLPLEEWCLAWRKDPLSGTSPSPGGQWVNDSYSWPMKWMLRSANISNTMPNVLVIQLFCSSCASFTLKLFMSLSKGEDFGFLRLGSPGLVDFGQFGTVGAFLPSNP